MSSSDPFGFFLKDFEALCKMHGVDNSLVMIQSAGIDGGRVRLMYYGNTNFFPRIEDEHWVGPNKAACIRCDGSGRAENDGEEGRRVSCSHCNGTGTDPGDDDREFCDPSPKNAIQTISPVRKQQVRDRLESQKASEILGQSRGAWRGSGNYEVDDEANPTKVTFVNGRTVEIVDGRLVVGWDRHNPHADPEGFAEITPENVRRWLREWRERHAG